VPSKLQSYLAAGKPIIASCNGVAADIVRKANAGMTSPAGDADALKRAVLDVYRMPQESRSRLGENAKLFFKANYFLPHKISELIEHFEWVISEQKASKDIARMA
jgi:glycosyltransferase involved in cell wall biosynthesis